MARKTRRGSPNSPRTPANPSRKRTRARGVSGTPSGQEPPGAPNRPPRRGSSELPDDLVQLAVVGRPHGVRGELTLWLHNPNSPLLYDLVAAYRGESEPGGRLFQLMVFAPDDRPAEPVVWDVDSLRKGRKGAHLLRVRGLEDRDDAERFKGWRILVPKALLPALDDEDEFYFHQIEGAEVVTVSGSVLGSVRAVVETSCEVLEIAREGGGELLVPVLKDTVVSFGPPVVVVDEVLDWFDTSEPPASGESE